MNLIRMIFLHWGGGFFQPCLSQASYSPPRVALLQAHLDATRMDSPGPALTFVGVLGLDLLRLYALRDGLRRG
jgi:hypothetical protein